VNPSRDTVQGIAAHASVEDLPAGSIDLACVAVPPGDVTSVIRACEGRGIPHAVVLSGGADESLARHLSGEGATTRVYGPNSLGVVSPPSRLYASFAGMLALPLDQHESGEPGVAFVSQSGAIASALGSRLVADGVNLTRWFSTGNEVDVDLAEVLDHLADDEMTRMVLVYIEGIRHGQAFMDAAARCRENGKRVVAYKSGTSDSGRQAIISHTGAIAGADRVYDAIFRRSGVIRVDTLQHLLDAGRLVGLAGQGGDRIGVITMSGGAAAIIADQCDRRGLRLSRFSDRTAGILGGLIPAYGSATNPIDLTADAVLAPDDVASAVRAVMDDDDVDIVACQFTTNADPTASTMAAALVRLVESGPKPLIIGRLGAEELAPEAIRVYHDAGVPVFDTPERLVDAAWILSSAGSG
jgi:acyl-CoA synthetase (NDP forming)